MRGRRRASGGVNHHVVHQAKGRQWPLVVVEVVGFPQTQRGPGGRTLGAAAQDFEPVGPHCGRSTTCASSTWPSPGPRICWCSPPAARYVRASAPVWEDAPRGAERTRPRGGAGSISGSVPGPTTSPIGRSSRAASQRMVYRFKRLDVHIGRRRRGRVINRCGRRCWPRLISALRIEAAVTVRSLEGSLEREVRTAAASHEPRDRRFSRKERYERTWRRPPTKRWPCRTPAGAELSHPKEVTTP